MGLANSVGKFVYFDDHHMLSASDKRRALVLV